ncbi:MAG: poly-beta-1,6-N-acetyl-D-glucosamine N-deacetylase PgaB, partial [bacterium]|nr:poly-beta-1,6-N-acetyl-D-glucosamine N-deacetylase PgaB [bacterium]
MSFHISASEPNTFVGLCYHDVRDKVHEHYDPDMMAISTDHLISHFSWLKSHNYHPVSIDDLLNARKGIKPLPENAVLITFDDGLKSIYTKVFPLLKLFNYPAVVALVGKWEKGGKEMKVKYPPWTLTEDSFLTEAQIRELDRSGLVEFASHSYNMHRGVLGNPQGNMQPAPSARTYYPGTNTYESDDAYKKRIRADLEKSVRRMKKVLGKGPRVMVWPYGKYNRTTVEIAASLGMVVTLTLETKRNTVANLAAVGRNLIMRNPNTDDLIFTLRYPFEDTDPVRIVQVDMDYLYDDNKKVLLKNFDTLISRIYRLNIRVVFLQAFADPDGDGTADALYFPNRHLPMRADLFNRVAWQLKGRSGVKVFAWLPVTAFDIPEKPGKKPLHYVMEAGKNGVKPSAYKRLSVFDPEARAVISGIYEDLARHADYDGIHYHDDAFLTDYEDAGPLASAFYQKEWGLPPDIHRIRENPEFFKKWSAKKAQFLVDFTRQLTRSTARYC